LRAASTLLPALQTGYSSSDRTSPAINYGKAFYFFCAVIGWYDILSCATTGSKPWIPEGALISESTQLHFHDVMGCENWAMALIMEIASLNELRLSSQKLGRLDFRDLDRQAAGLKQRLEHGLAQFSESVEEASEHIAMSSSELATTTPLHKTITRIFASAALVYLEVVVFRSQSGSSEMREAVSRTIAAFKTLGNLNAIGSLTWPFTIAGCMATGEQKDFFRATASENGQSDSGFGNFRRCFEIIEECWRMRQDDKDGTYCWTSAMRVLDKDLLLV
jgi:hypothetical protein